MSRRSPGEGSIFERKDGRHVAVLVLGWEGQHRKRRYLYGSSRSEVVRRLAEAQRALKSGTAQPDDRLTVAGYLADWLDAVQPTIRPSTWTSYEGHVRLHIDPAIGRIPLQRLEPADVRRMHRSVLAGHSAATTQRVHATLRIALGQAHRDGLVARNVAALATPPRAPRPEIRPLTSVDAASILAACEGDRLYALFVMALGLGLRRGELLGLSWTDVGQTTLTVRHQLIALPDQPRHKRLVLTEPKTSRSRRTVTMPDLVAHALRDHAVLQAEEQLQAGNRWKDHGLVFTTPIGTPLEGTAVTRRFAVLLREAGLPPMRLHDLRHGTATLLLAQGVPMRTIADILGHSTPSITANVYAGVTGPMMDEAAAGMNRALSVSAKVSSGRE